MFSRFAGNSADGLGLFATVEDVTSNHSCRTRHRIIAIDSARQIGYVKKFFRYVWLQFFRFSKQLKIFVSNQALVRTINVNLIIFKFLKCYSSFWRTIIVMLFHLRWLGLYNRRKKMKMMKKIQRNVFR